MDIKEIDLAIKQIILNKHLFTTQRCLDPECIRPEVLTHYTGHLVLRLSASVWGEDLPAKIITYPADWWQAFKQRWFPGWALKRWPVAHTVIHLKGVALYPDYQPKLDGQHCVVKILEVPGVQS